MKVLHVIIALLIFQGISGQTGSENFLRARSLMLTSNFDSAIYYLDRAMEESPDNITYTYNRGLCNFELKRYDKALTDFLFVNKRRTGMASLMLAKTESRLKRDELAIKYLREHLGSQYKIPEKDILLDNDFMHLESGAAWKALWREKEWYSPADRDLQEIIYMKSRGEYLEVINRLNALDQKRYKRTLVHQYLAETYLVLGNKKAAAEALDRSIAADTRNMESLKLRIDLFFSSGNLAQANKDCERLLRQAPDEFEHYLVSATIQSRLGEYEKSLRSVNYYLFFYPDSAKAYNVLGLVHYNNGKHLDAIKAYNKTLALDQGKAAYYFNRGRAFAATKTHVYASRDFSMALDLNPVDPEIWFMKGLTELELGSRDSACFSFRKAAQLGKYEAREYINRLCGK
jgi:tetratricopeptide (TPR) repeat protein